MANPKFKNKDKVVITFSDRIRGTNSSPLAIVKGETFKGFIFSRIIGDDKTGSADNYYAVDVNGELHFFREDIMEHDTDGMHVIDLTNV